MIDPHPDECAPYVRAIARATGVRTRDVCLVLDVFCGGLDIEKLADGTEARIAFADRLRGDVPGWLVQLAERQRQREADELERQKARIRRELGIDL